ncbi:hypothetical protein LTR17_024212 [Elasticomyces elasticus]|nr:hypothetical protein LTR17_024212 [Elasticomyces elasticus]
MSEPQSLSCISANEFNVHRDEINGPVCRQVFAELQVVFGQLAKIVRPLPPEARPSVLPSGSIFLVAEARDEGRSYSPGPDETPYPLVAGSLVLVPLEPGARSTNGLRQDGKVAEVKRIVTRSAYRRRGVAGALLATVEGIARSELGVELLVLETNHAMVGTQKTYERYGWKRREVYGWYNSDDSVCYEKRL